MCVLKIFFSFSILDGLDIIRSAGVRNLLYRPVNFSEDAFGQTHRTKSDGSRGCFSAWKIREGESDMGLNFAHESLVLVTST